MVNVDNYVSRLIALTTTGAIVWELVEHGVWRVRLNKYAIEQTQITFHSTTVPPKLSVSIGNMSASGVVNGNSAHDLRVLIAYQTPSAEDIFERALRSLEEKAIQPSSTPLGEGNNTLSVPSAPFTIY